MSAAKETEDFIMAQIMADDFEKMLIFITRHFQSLGVDRSRIRRELLKIAAELEDKPQ